MRRKRYPILEFDTERRAIIEPSQLYKPLGLTERCVMCYHKDVVEKAAATSGAKVVFEEKGVYGVNPFYLYQYRDQPLMFFNPIIGAAVGAGFLEIAIALGCRKFIVCGGAGVLDRNIAVGAFIVVDAAVRDEGTSYHYVPAGRQIEAARKPIDALGSTLDEHGESYLVGKVWTTDGIFRETRAKVALRKREGCVAVDMEAAALLAVAQYRRVELGYLLSGGDDVSGQDWDRRENKPRAPNSERLFWLSADACVRL